MTAVTGALRRRVRATPLQDYAHKERASLRPSGVFAWPIFYNKLRRSNMFGLAFRLVKLAGYLFVILIVLLLALNFKVVYQGDGNFAVRAKDSWSFTGTFVSESNTAPAAIIQAPVAQRTIIQRQTAPARMQLPQQRPQIRRAVAAPVSALQRSLTECGRFRRDVEEAIERYNSLHPRSPMTQLDIFALLSEGLIDQIPNCPAGGEFRLGHSASGHVTISCTRHIE